MIGPAIIALGIGVTVAQILTGKKNPEKAGEGGPTEASPPADPTPAAPTPAAAAPAAPPPPPPPPGDNDQAEGEPAASTMTEEG